MLRIKQEALTFDDVLLVPAHSTVLPNTANLSTQLTKEIRLNIPMLSAAMDTVTETKLAISLAQEGGIGFIHKNMTIERQADRVRKVKKFESGIVSEPVTVSPDLTLAALAEMVKKNGFAGYPVVDGENNLIGIITGRDTRFVKDLSKTVSQLMTKKENLVTVKEGASRETILELMHKNRVEKVLVVDDAFKLKGMITVKDFQKAEQKPNACKDEFGRLRVGAAVGAGPGNEERIEKLAKELDLSLEGIEIINLRHDREAERRERYARILSEKRARQGANLQESNDKMFERNYFGMMMVETGEADAFITGLYTKYSNTIKVAKEVIGIQPEYKHFGTMHILNSKKGTYFVADTLINRHPDTDTLIDIAKLSKKTVEFFNHTPTMAMLSYSNFGSDTEGSPAKVHDAVDYMQKEYPELAIDGEMQVNFALNTKLRDEKYPFTRLKGKEVNTLVFPNLSSANATYQLIQSMSETEVIGPIQMGLNKPIHFTDCEASVRDIVNITAVAVIDAIVDKKKKEK